MRPDPIALVARPALARALGAPQRRPLGDLLARNAAAGAYPGLADLKAADLSEVTHTLIPARPNPFFGDPVAAAFSGTSINPVLFGEATTAPLTVTEWREVSLIAHGGLFTIMRGDTVDERSRALPKGRAALKDAAEQRLASLAYLDGRNSNTNPAHVIGDLLPRLIHLRTLAGVAEADCGIGPPPAALAQHALARIAPGVRRLNRRTLYRVDRLTMVSSAFSNLGHPFYYLDPVVVDAIVPALQPRGSGPPRRLYLARTDTPRRQLLNEPALITQLADDGFQPVVMGAIAPAEQLRLARHAEVIVGPHGAALTNLVAARPAVRVVELFHPLVGTAAFAAIARLRGLDYHALFGEPVDEADEADGHRPWRIDIDAVRAAL